MLKCKNYYASVQFSSEDEVFYGKVIGINDLIIFEGISIKELKTAFKEAVEDYLNLCADLGKTPQYNHHLNV